LRRNCRVFFETGKTVREAAEPGKNTMREY